MFHMLLSFVLSFRAYFRTQADNQLEILALRHQIVVLQRQNRYCQLEPFGTNLGWPESEVRNSQAAVTARQIVKDRHRSNR